MSDLIALILSENNLEGSKRLEKTPHRSGGLDRPHLEAARPLGPTISLRVAMLVLHHLLGCIYTVL